MCAVASVGEHTSRKKKEKEKRKMKKRKNV